MPNPSSGRARSPLRWLGVAPFFLFVTLFLILPTLYIVVGAFRGRRRRLHLRQHPRAQHPHDPQRLLGLDQGQLLVGAASAA
jgi:ABC-type sugar transport system permease subunit